MSEELVRETGLPKQGQLVMPFYLICDVSYSMLNDMPALNDCLQRLRRAIVAERVVDDVAHICSDDVLRHREGGHAARAR